MYAHPVLIRALPERKGCTFFLLNSSFQVEVSLVFSAHDEMNFHLACMCIQKINVAQNRLLHQFESVNKTLFSLPIDGIIVFFNLNIV